MNPLDDDLPRPEPVLLLKADLGRRFLAFLIDNLIAGLAGAVFGLINPVLGVLVNAGYMMLRDGFDVEFMDHRSIGKRLMNLRPVRLDGAPVDLETSLRRNWMFGIGSVAQATFRFGLGTVVSVAAAAVVIYEVYRVFTDPSGRRWGDELGTTQVVDATPGAGA